jgi:hypothetical protein
LLNRSCPDAFLVLYATTKTCHSVLVPVALAAVSVVSRLHTHTPMTQAFAGIVGIAISAILALVSGRAEANFIPGIVINGVGLAVLLISILVRWHSSGVIVGFLTRRDRSV